MKYNFLLLCLYCVAACIWGEVDSLMLPCYFKEKGERHILKKKNQKPS